MPETDPITALVARVYANQKVAEADEGAPETVPDDFLERISLGDVLRTSQATGADPGDVVKNFFGQLSEGAEE